MKISWWCQAGKCLTCFYARCGHACHEGQLGELDPEARAAGIKQAREDLAAYFRSNSGWRGYGHAAAIAAQDRP